MKSVYIAASWKHALAVQLLTKELRAMSTPNGAPVDVWSFVENNRGEQKGHAATEADGTPMRFDKWVCSERGRRSFEYDVESAMHASLVVYIGPSGTDAWAEVGAAYGAGVPIVGYWGKGEPAGLMRLMMCGWSDSMDELLGLIREELGVEG